MELHSVANNAFTTVAVAVAAIDTEIVVDASSLDSVATPFYADIGSELIEVTAVSTDDPEAGQSAWTVVRAVAGAAAAYSIDAPVLQRVYAQATTEIHEALLNLEFAFNLITGATDGVITPPDLSSLKVVPDDPASMDVAIQVGAAFVSGSIVAVRTEGTLTLTAPVSGSRTDLIQINDEGTLSVKTGSTTPDTDNIGLAEIAMTDATTTLTLTEITDARTFI